jgi:hypothetical protein
MRDRLSAAAQKTGYRGDLSELVVSTIHSLCNRLLSQHRHRTELGHNYETLDELTQLLFIFDHFDDIIGPVGQIRTGAIWAAGRRAGPPSRAREAISTRSRKSSSSLNA